MFRSLESLWGMFDECFEEWQAIKDNEGSGHTPRYTTHEIHTDSPNSRTHNLEEQYASLL